MLIVYLIFSLLFSPVSAGAGEPSKLGLFVSLIQNPPTLSSPEQIKKLVEFAHENRIDTLFVQVYRANKAWFPSRRADTAQYELYSRQMRGDPFAFLMQEAHAKGIKVHAWLNCLSLSTNKDAPLLKKYGTDILTKNLSPKKKIEDYKIDGQYFLEPGDLRVREEMVGITEDLLEAYPELDGIQFDYIRYPDVKPFYGFTKENVRRFKEAAGVKVVAEKSEAWQNWKRAQVTELVEALVRKTRAIRPDIEISTTGCAPYSRALAEAFQDWPSWIERGLVDFVTLMSYPDNLAEFQKEIAGFKAKSVDFEKINIAIPAYKLVRFPRVFSEMFDFCRESGGRACVVFHYGSMLENPALSRSLIPDKTVKQ